MPRPGPVRPSVTLRLDADTIAWLDKAAEEAGVTRSDLIRRAVEVKIAGWPDCRLDTDQS